jgi:hypothetical protein
MSHSLVVPGIRFNDCVFGEPVRLADWLPPKCGGLFVVLARDPNWSPKPFQPLCFGEFGNNEREGISSDGWAPPVGGVENLFVAALPLPFSTTAQRCAIRNDLVWAYNPPCQANSARTSVRELAHRLDALEVKQQEQNTQILLLLNHLNRFFEPQPSRPQRPIGFLPQLAGETSG